MSAFDALRGSTFSATSRQLRPFRLYTQPAEAGLPSLQAATSRGKFPWLVRPPVAREGISAAPATTFWSAHPSRTHADANAQQPTRPPAAASVCIATNVVRLPSRASTAIIGAAMEYAVLAQIQVGVLSAWQTVTITLDLLTGVLSIDSRSVRLRGADVSYSRRGTTVMRSSKARRTRLVSLQPAPGVTRAAWKSFSAALSLAAFSPPGYRLLRLLGQGGSGRVYLAAPDSDISARVALKLVTRTKCADVAAELRMACAAPKHPSLVPTQGTFLTPKHLVVVMPYVPGGSLLDKAEGAVLPPAALRAMARQLVEALAALHGSGIAHRDVKLENAVLDSAGALRLCDLGLAAAEPPRGFRNAVGTAYTQAPEVAQGVRYGRPADMWSAGVVILVLVLRAVPFTLRNRDGLFRAMGARDGAGGDLLAPLIGAKKREMLPLAMLDFLRGLLRVDPAKRLSAQQALAHPWLLEDVGKPPANVLSIMGTLMQIRRRVTTIRTGVLRKRLLATVRVVAFVNALHALVAQATETGKSQEKNRVVIAPPTTLTIVN